MTEIVLMTNSHKKKELPPLAIDDFVEKQLDLQIEELGLKVSSGEAAIADRKELHMLLNQILSYPSTEQAEMHRNANRLGQLDVDKEGRYNRISDKNMWSQQECTHICKCCGFMVQEQALQTCSNSIESIHSLGISTYLYFRTIINLAILLGIMLVVYSSYTFITNIIASNLNVNGTQSKMLSYLIISLGSKQLYASEEKVSMYVVGAWIGLVMLLLWGVVILGLKYYQKESEVAILLENKSVAEYSLVIEKIPTGLSKEEIAQQFKAYFSELKQREELTIDDLEVVKYNEGQPCYFNEAEFNDADLNKELEMVKVYQDLFKGWILSRRTKDEFTKNQKFRTRKYTEYQRVIDRKRRIVDQITKSIKEMYQHKNKESKTTAFVTFATNHQKNFVLDYNPNSFLTRIKNMIPCLRNPNRFVVRKGQVTYEVRISPAPDPEDIIWSNIGVNRSERWGRKLVTYSITALILAISFVIAYSLSTAQVNNQNNKILSIIISLSIAVINLVIGLVIELLTGYERDYTMTNYQISLHIKTVFAQLVNSIFIPIIANYFIKQNIYFQNGLIEDVLILGITNSLVYPIGKLINPAYLLRYFYAKYKLLPANKLDLHQYEINQLYEKQEFEVGYQYIYVVNLFIFTCFFVSLQPILPVFALLGLLLIYWVMKHNLFHRCQRPVPGTPIINTTASQLIYFGAVAYTLGSMTWANFIPTSELKSALLPNLFAMSAAFIIFVIPYESIFRGIFKNKRMPQVSYKQNRIFFTSEYDRLNPSTSEAGVKDYYAFLQDKIKELEEKDAEFKARLSFELQFNNRPNFYKQPTDDFTTRSKYEGKTVIGNILKKETKNSMTPQMIATVLLKDLHHNRTLAMLNSQLRNSMSKINRINQSVINHSLRKNNSIEEKHHVEPQVLEECHSEQYVEGLEKVQSIKFQNLGKMSNFTYKPDKSCELPQKPVELDVGENFLGEVSQVKSYIIKTQSKSSLPSKVKIENENELPSKIKLEMQSEVPSKKEMLERPGDPNGKKPSRQITLREYMQRRKESVEEVDCYEEVPNRFSINCQNMLPICLQSQGSSLLQSQVRFYNLGSFQ